MNKLLLATAATALMSGAAFAESHTGDVKIGIELGFTGPLESITPAMGAGADLAIAEINAAGTLLDGATVTAIRADSTCIDAGAATAAAEGLVTGDMVNAIMGADCSGVTGAVLQNVARPNGIVMISPSATSPALSQAEDDGLFFRVAPSDARQGEVMTNVLQDRGIESVALTYTNNDYGKGLADAIQTEFEAKGGVVTIVASHEDGKADYSAEMGALASAGGDLLVVAGYLDQGGLGIIRASIDSGAWDTFGLPGGMIGDSITENLGDELNGSYGQIAGSGGEGTAKIKMMSEAAGFDGTSPYSPESYDAAALFMLAMEAAGSTDPADYNAKILEIANAPGEQILPGELAKALEIIRAGGDIDYVGASSVELIGGGESAGNYREVMVVGGKFETVGFR